MPPLKWTLKKGNYSSTTCASGAFFITEAIPALRVVSDAYIWLAPITWPLVALRLDWNSPFFLVVMTNFPRFLIIGD